MFQSHPAPLLSSSSFRLIVCCPELNVQRLLISLWNQCFYCPRLFRQNIQMSFKVAERSDGWLFSEISKCHCVGPWKRRACSGALFNTSLSPLPSFRSRLCWKRRLLRWRTLTMDGPAAAAAFCKANLWFHLQIRLTRAASFAFIRRCVVNRACCYRSVHLSVFPSERCWSGLQDVKPDMF